ncbi:MAG: MFS transporter [Thermotoga caldifontis]
MRQRLISFSIEFFAYASLACMTLLSHYFVHIGLSPSIVGLLMALPSINALWANQLYFFLAYKLGVKKVVLYFSLLGIASVWSLFASRIVALIFTFSFLLMFSQGALVPLLESSLVEFASQSNFAYGKIRLFGTLGYAFASFVIARLVSRGFSSLFVLYSLLFFLIGFAVQKSELGVRFQRRPSVRSVDKRFFLLFTVVTASVGFNLFNSVFLPVLVESKRFRPESVGLSLALMAMSEIPFLLLAERIVKKLGSLRLLLSAFFVVGLRLVLTPLAVNETQLILIQLLHGWTYIVIYYSVLFLMRQMLSGHVLEGTQIVFWMSLQGVGPLLGSSVGGVVVEHLGAEATYLTFGFIAIFLVLAGWFIKKNYFEGE